MSAILASRILTLITQIKLTAPNTAQVATVIAKVSMNAPVYLWLTRAWAGWRAIIVLHGVGVRMATDSKRLAVIGAGLAGLTLAQRMQDAGWCVTLFEKARGPGGRMSTRRRDGGQFDHGAQYFTARSPSFAAAIARWEQAGAVAAWTGTFALWDAGGLRPDPSKRVRWVGTPRMSALTRHLSQGLTIRAGHRVVAIEDDTEGWSIVTDQGIVAPAFDWVVLTCPGPQAKALVPANSPVHARAAKLRYSPCWAAMMECEPARIGADGIRLEHPMLSWAARDSSKPGRPPGHRWVIHANPEWTKSHVDESPDAVAREMQRACEAVLGVEAQTVSVHRWLYSLAATGSGEAACVDRAQRLGLCGDGLVGGRVEHAWSSAMAMADALIGSSTA